jgi:hypothetical protein
LEQIRNWIPDGEGGYTKCTYNETVCDCYDKDPSHVYEHEGWKDLWGYAPWAWAVALQDAWVDTRCIRFSSDPSED